MLFLTDNDFLPIIRDEFLAAIIDQDDSILSTAELTAMATVEEYLSQQFDIAAVWATTGTQRNHYLIRIMISLIRYDLYQRLPKGGFGAPTDVSSDKREAIEWLKLVSTGTISSKLPAKTTNGTPATRTRWGSDTRQRWD